MSTRRSSLCSGPPSPSRVSRLLARYFSFSGFASAEEQHTIHVAEDGFRVLVVDGLALGQLLIQQTQADLTGTDDGHQLFKLGHLSCVGRLVPQYPHVMGQPAAVNIVRPFTQ